MKLMLLILMLSPYSHAKLTIGSYNIRNFDYDTRSNVPTNKAHLAKMIYSLDADIIGLQEIHETEVFDHMIQKVFLGKYATVFTTCGGAHQQRLGFVYNTLKFDLIFFDQDLRTVGGSENINETNCNQGSRPIAIAHFREKKTRRVIVATSLHLKSGGRERNVEKRFKQLKVLKNLITEKKSQGFEHFIVTGDFNSTQYQMREKSHRKFVKLVAQMGLTDTAANVGCSSYWWGGVDDQTQYPSLLDHILVSPSLLNTGLEQARTAGHCSKLQCQITHDSQMGVSFDEVSDHCPLVLDIE